MMADQALFLDEVARFGDPWHGLYRGGVLELPNAATRPMNVAPDSGDCFEIRVPGTPAVTTDSADAAAGMTWLDYGLIAGRRHVLYQTVLGDLSWVYVASDKSTWKATVAWSGLNAGTLTLRPLFGSAPVQTLSLSMSPAISYQAAIAGVGRVMDIRQDGAAVVFAHLVNTEGTPYTEWNIRASSRLDIAGIPPAASAGLTLIHEIDHPTLSGVASSDVRNYSETFKQHWVYYEGDVLVDEGDEEFSLTWHQPDGSDMVWPAPPKGSWSGPAAISFYENRQDWTRTDLVGYFFAGDGALTEVKIKQRSVNNFGYSGPFAILPYPILELPEGWSYFGTTNDAQSLLLGNSESADVRQRYVVNPGRVFSQDQTIGNRSAWYWRYANRMYGLTETLLDDATIKFHPPMSPVGAVIGAPITGVEKPFASFQPITGQRIFSPSGTGIVCWV